MDLNDLEKLRYLDLAHIRTHIEELMDKKKAEEIARLQETLAMLDMKPEELAPKKNGKGNRSPAKPKYANPADPTQTYSGRGKHPAWFREALANGKTEDELLIQ